MPTYKDSKTGKWFCKFYYTDYTGTRKQKCKRGFALKRDADQWERDFLLKSAGSPEMTFAALAGLYLEDLKTRRKPSTVYTRSSAIRLHIMPYFENKPVNHITTADIRKWQNTLLQLNYSASYLRRINDIMSMVLNFAVRYYNLPFNPCSRAERIGKHTRSLTFWTLDQYRAALDHVQDPAAHAALQVLFYSGMRYGEMAALTPADIDFKENTICINKTYLKLPGTHYTGTPKTDNSFRVVIMPAPVMEELRAYMARLYGLEDNDRIFTFTRGVLRRAMVSASSAAGVPFIRIHDLRHSHVSLLIDMGFNPHLIAARIGDTVQMVNNTYGHLYPDKSKSVADQLNQLF